MGTSFTDLTSISTRGWFLDTNLVDSLLEPVSTFGWSYELTTDPTLDELNFDLNFNTEIAMGDLLFNAQSDFTSLINSSSTFDALINTTADFDSDFTTNIHLNVTTLG